MAEKDKYNPFPDLGVIMLDSKAQKVLSSISCPRQ